jgi:hypothetical protein
MVCRADADQGLARPQVGADRVELVLRRRGPSHEDDEQIGTPHRRHESLEMGRLRLVSHDDRHPMPRRPQFPVREAVEKRDRVVVVGVLARDADDVGGTDGRTEQRYHRDEDERGRSTLGGDCFECRIREGHVSTPGCSP